MDRTVALNFRDQLREARAVALRDAEAFEEVVFVIERLGVYLTGSVAGLGGYARWVADEARVSPLAEDIPSQLPDWHTTFATLYALVQQARNDALHEGAFARHLTRHAVDLSLVLEDALMVDAVSARDFMVSDPVCALWWQPISSIRRNMLANSFSFLPVATEGGGGSRWRLLSDFSLASYLRSAESRAARNNLLARRLGDVVQAGDITLSEATVCGPEDSVGIVLERSQGKPVLVVGSDGDLRGIVTPFDVL
jgi:CBS domain-containing protein